MCVSSSRSIPPPVYERMREVMELTVHHLFPSDTNSSAMIKAHVWRDANYVGIASERVEAWRGLSVNFRSLNQGGYRTLYFDYVNNNLPLDARTGLFGLRFVQHTERWNAFVFLFVTSIPERYSRLLSDKGIVFRRVNTIIHPGYAQNIDKFLEMPPDVWAKRGIQLLELQRTLIESAP